MRPALLPQRESGAVLYSSHAHCKNIREQPRTPDAEIHGSLFRPSRAAQLSYSHRCRAGHWVQAQPAGPLGAGLACLPAAVNRHQLCIPKRKLCVVLHPQDCSGSVERSIRCQKAERTRFPARQLNRVGETGVCLTRQNGFAQHIPCLGVRQRQTVFALSPRPPKASPQTGQLRLRPPRPMPYPKTRHPVR